MADFLPSNSIYNPTGYSPNGDPVGTKMQLPAPTPLPTGGKTITDLLGTTPAGGPSTQNPLLTDLSSILGSYGQGEKADRVVKGNFTENYDKLLAALEASRNNTGLSAQTNYDTLLQSGQKQRDANESDALRKLQQTDYLASGGNNYKPTSIMLGGQSRALPDFGFGPKGTSATVQAGARALQGQLMPRLSGGDTVMPTQFKPNFDFKPHDLNDYAKPGVMERISDYGSPILAGLGALGVGGNGQPQHSGAGSVISNILHSVSGIGGGGSQPMDEKIPGLGGSNPLTGLLGKIPGLGKSSGNGLVDSTAGGAGNILGKVAPYAGAVTGTLGLLKDRGLGSNVMNGLTAGASFGSILPGLGTGIGAAIGAGVGALRGIGHIGKPSAQELAGRDLSHQGISALGKTVTPAEMSEAQASAQGAGGYENALALIHVRDSLIQHGMDSAQADQFASNYITQIKQAEKQGPQAVAQTLSTIQKMMA